MKMFWDKLMPPLMFKIMYTNYAVKTVMLPLRCRLKITIIVLLKNIE